MSVHETSRLFCARRVAARVERKSKEMDTTERLVVEILAVLAAIERDTGCEFVRRHRLGIIDQAVSIGETGGPDRLEVLPAALSQLFGGPRFSSASHLTRATRGATRFNSGAE